jgi:aryl-alcohol dehydrogenase-like predicted oxidoreductase
MNDFSTLTQQVIAQTSSASATGLPTRVLGRTNVRVSIIGIGGWHLGAIKEEADAIHLMHAAIDEGLTFFDNAWDYQDGHAEELMGKALAMDGRRDKVFLMTKNCNRDYAGSMKCLEDSLRRLQTDYLDLWQFHECNYDNDPDWVFETGGMEAALEARRAGKVRFIGFTGHKDPRIHLNMLAKPHDWDAAQMPINLMDAHYRSFLHNVVPVCLQKNTGVIGMKGLGGGWPDGRFLSDAGLTPEECYRFCLSLPVSVQVMGINTLAQLRHDIKIVREFVPMPGAEMESALGSLKTVAGDGRHELFKSTTDFDGPHHRIQHGFAAAAG